MSSQAGKHVPFGDLLSDLGIYGAKKEDNNS